MRILHRALPRGVLVAALTIVTASPHADTAVRWANTVHYSGAVRLEHPSSTFLNDANADDGERNFRKGAFSNRVDLLSELNLMAGPLGFEASAAAWYDTLYNQRIDHGSPATLNSVSNGPGKFAKAVRKLHGRNAELLTAFAYTTIEAGNTPVSLRVGRSHLQWGESLFFADNGIAAGQTPIDSIKGLGVPGSKAKEVYLPVTQVWTSAQPSENFSLEAYYQFQWRRNRLPGSGSYFNTADFLDAGGERLIVGPGQFFKRRPDQVGSDSGQFGLAMHFSRDEGDYGFYGLRFNAKDPQLYLRLGPFVSQRLSSTSSATLPGLREREGAALYGLNSNIVVSGTGNQFQLNYGLYGDPNTGEVGTYNLTYPQGIQIYGASYSGYIGATTLGAEVSVRRHTPLTSKTLVQFESTLANNTSAPQYAIGESLHGQISAIGTLAPGRLWQGATIAAELAANHRMRVTANSTAFDTNRSRSAVSMRIVFEPQYFAVMPGLDITVPIGAGLGLAGRSSVNQSQNEGAGDVEIGIRAIYRTVWEANLQLTHFMGAPSRQPFADRDFLSFSIKRTF